MSDKLTTCDRCGSDACYVQEVTNKIQKLYVLWLWFYY
jgi:hypothetical protein